MRLKLVLVILAVAASFVVSPAYARAADDYANLVKADLLADFDHIRAGQSFKLGVRMKIKEHWHTYWANPGENGQPTEIKWTAPKELTFGEIQWPVPKKLLVDGATIYGYEDEVLLIVPVTTTATLPQGKLPIKAKVEWLSCKETCIEGKADLSIDMRIGLESNPANVELFAKYEGMLPVRANQPPADAAVAKIEQAKDAGGKPAPALTVQWKQKPVKVDWFPLSNDAAAVSDIKIEENSGSTNIRCKTDVFSADGLAAAGGQIGGVLVYEDAGGKRVGVEAPLRVNAEKK